ncbi:YbjQ family protein [Pseudoalteromonas sp. SR43-2]|uniref:YbjQ family protein n=1 Tax=Pseudoalteromonas sp. SR43-2 TaxID=2760944 RepID=UPI0021760194|nr:YbjQ family protein [Pseudoalteromonas sp. SR43-2]
MFFSKKTKTESDKKTPMWSISEKGLKNTITNQLYDTEGLTYCSKVEGDNVHATIWYHHKYLCNLTVLTSQSNVFRNNYISECDAFIDDFKDVEFVDQLDNKIEISIPNLNINSKSYVLSGIRTLDTNPGYKVHHYGKYITTVNEESASIIETAKEIYLQRKYGVSGSNTKSTLDEMQSYKVELNKLHNLNPEKVLVTTETAPNLNILKRIDVITAECVYGMNIFMDIFASFTDVLGGRSNSIQNTLRDARKTALAELRKEAASIGANAVIAVDLDYSEISGGGKSGMLFIVASGTAVIIE